ncbi:hypothetical protein [Thalassospira sp.]|uniref:glycine-rich domain-containing protein n=1 Tax=Thalassospira sp. TaxID=1912094 RepID=UPI003AA7E958
MSNPDRSWFNADPANAIEGSRPSAQAFEHPIREIVKVIMDAGLEPDGNDLTQLSAAVTTMIGSALTAGLPFRGLQVYDAAGSYEWVVPAGVTLAWVIVTGGGGAGGAGSGDSRGAGGSAGGTSFKLVDLSQTEGVPITVGRGGKYGAGTGGTSSFGTFCSATGGTPGNNYTGSTAPSGQPGDGVGGDINLVGGWGSDAPVQSGTGSGGSGDGGASYWGGGVRSGTGSGGSGVGVSGAPGSGAGGSAQSTTEARAGMVVIQW